MPLKHIPCTCLFQHVVGVCKRPYLHLNSRQFNFCQFPHQRLVVFVSRDAVGAQFPPFLPLPVVGRLPAERQASPQFVVIVHGFDGTAQGSLGFEPTTGRITNRCILGRRGKGLFCRKWLLFSYTQLEL